ncbi:MAG: ABC transporter permease subunit [Clostridia bacterium]|nr:ABC transporter permease subunit [Clostridia bacterium]
MRTIYSREMQGYFFTPIGYVFIGIFLLLSSVFFGVGNLTERSGNILFLLRNMSYLWMLLCPVLTMKLVAGERQAHTDQLLYSSPCSLSGVITGKFFAACTVLLAAIVLSFVYPALVAIYGKLYLTETLVGYLGFLLTGCTFIALDIFVSCFAKSVVTSAIMCFGVNLMVWFFDVIALAAKGTVIADFFVFLSPYQRFTPFTLGQLSWANLLYGFLICAIMIFLSIRVLDARRWSEA